MNEIDIARPIIMNILLIMPVGSVSAACVRPRPYESNQVFLLKQLKKVSLTFVLPVSARVLLGYFLPIISSHQVNKHDRWMGRSRLLVSHESLAGGMMCVY